MARPVQCVVSPSGSVSVRATIRSPTSGPNGAMPRARLVAKMAVDALCREALLPAPNGGLALARPSHDGRCAETVCCRQHDRGPPDMLLRAVAVRDDGMKPVTVRGGHCTCDPGGHAPDSHASIATGIPKRTLPSPSIH